jgi:hypothetical protein
LKRRLARTTTAALATAALLTGCASTAANSRTNHANVMVTVHLAADMDPATTGPKIAADAITQPGVTWSNYLPATGVVIDTDNDHDAAQVRAHLAAAWKAITATEQGPAPATVPIAGKS